MTLQVVASDVSLSHSFHSLSPLNLLGFQRYSQLFKPLYPRMDLLYFLPYYYIQLACLMIGNARLVSFSVAFSNLQKLTHLRCFSSLSNCWNYFICKRGLAESVSLLTSSYCCYYYSLNVSSCRLPQWTTVVRYESSSHHAPTFSCSNQCRFLFFSRCKGLCIREDLSRYRRNKRLKLRQDLLRQPFFHQPNITHMRSWGHLRYTCYTLDY